MENKVFRPRLTESENNVILAMRGKKESEPAAKLTKKSLLIFLKQKRNMQT